MTSPDKGGGAIDFHAHLLPECVWNDTEAGEDNYGLGLSIDSSEDVLVIPGRGHAPPSRQRRRTVEDRLRDMDGAGVAMQVLSLLPLFLRHDLEVGASARLCRDVNDEIARMTTSWPSRFRGLATLPLPDVGTSVAELRRAVTTLHLSGALLDTRVGKVNWDDPMFERIFETAEELDAVLFFHPSYSLVWEQSQSHDLGNLVGNPAEETLAGASLVLGGVIDRHPRLKCVLAHGGGYLSYGIGRIDRGWRVRPEARLTLSSPPSRSLRSLYYDSVTSSESGLRFLIDAVGADRVLLGSDWPNDADQDDGVKWLASLNDINESEKALIRRGNAASLLGGVE